MLTLHRKLGFVAFAGLGILIGAALTPARAQIGVQSLTANGVSTNTIRVQALSATALITSGSALCDLNGVAVEAVTLPQALEY